jgi:hypothetical protein
LRSSLPICIRQCWHHNASSSTILQSMMSEMMGLGGHPRPWLFTITRISMIQGRS